MIKSLTLTCLLLAGLAAAIANTAKDAPEKIGWVETEHPGIIEAYDAAMKAGIYEKSLLFTGEIVKHYATTNHKEYFAEATEAYFYHNDFYPFVRAELFLHDPKAHALMEEIWGKAK